MTPSLDVLCVGSANLDMIAVVDHVPGDDERVTTEQFISAGGGPAATAAVTLARLGLRTGMCAVVGDDDAGRLVRAGLQSERINTTWVTSSPMEQTTRSLVLACRSTGSRSIVTMIGKSPEPDTVPVGEAAWLHVDQVGYRAARQAIARAGSRPKLSVDGGNPIDDLDLSGVELYAPTLAALLARYETTNISQALAAAHDEGARLVVATDGARGTYVLTGRDVAHVPAFDTVVVSTIGAGDVFHGALLSALIRGAPILDAVRTANAAAALACRAIDGRSAIPTAQELSDFMRDAMTTSEASQ